MEPVLRCSAVGQSGLQVALGPENSTEAEPGQGGDPEVPGPLGDLDRLPEGLRGSVELAELLLGSAEVGPVVGLAPGEALSLGSRGGPAQVLTRFGVAVLGLRGRSEHGVDVDQEPRIAHLLEQASGFVTGVQGGWLVAEGEGDMGGQDPRTDLVPAATEL